MDFKKVLKVQQYIVSSGTGDFYQAQIAPDCSLQLSLRIEEVCLCQ